jgi:hypothetical protein
MARVLPIQPVPVPVLVENARILDVFDNVVDKLAEAGIFVQRRDLEGFCQVLQVRDSLDQFDRDYKGRYFEAVEEIEARVAESDEDEDTLKAKYKQLENTLISFDDGDDDENVERQGAEGGLLGNMVQQMRMAKKNMVQLMDSDVRAQVQKELTRVQRRLAWPLFWRDILLKRGVDVEATVIRHLCAVLKIGTMGTSPKSRILKVKGRPTNQDFHAYCLHLKGVSSSSNVVLEVSTWEEHLEETRRGKGESAEDISSSKEALLKAKSKEIRNANCKRAVFTILLLLNSCYCFTPTIYFCSSH